MFLIKTRLQTIRKVWRYQRSNQKSLIEEEQTTQWPKEKGHKQRYAKHFKEN